MEELLLFIMTFILTFVIYEVFVVRGAKKRYKSKSKLRDEKEVLEVMYLTKVYNLDMDKISYFQLLQIIALVSSLDISIVVSIILLFDSFILRLIIGFLSIFVIILISYHIVYLFYKRKGMIKNERKHIKN